MLEDIACDHMLLYFTAKAGERNWSVIACLKFLPFLEYRCKRLLFASHVVCNRYQRLSKLFWKMAVRNGDTCISTANSFRTLAGTCSRSGPEAFLGLSFCSGFNTPALVTLMSCIDGYGVPSGVGILVLSSLVHIDWYWRFRISTLSLGSSWSFP